MKEDTLLTCPKCQGYDFLYNGIKDRVECTNISCRYEASRKELLEQQLIKYSMKELFIMEKNTFSGNKYITRV